MKMKPILFGSDMVRAILAGTEIQTRRIIKPSQPGLPMWVNREGYTPCVMDAYVLVRRFA
jgi:hypothetical protein